ncbi:MAG: histidine phosphatase family protein [Candidatus Yanofskybacteria bacterium]|nr:histidine phosphatase family protein [Candidatus Yanofskybacteria bacterium]
MINPKTELVFHFFRHGQSEANVKSEFISGDEDSPITHLGIKQAKALGQRLKKENLTFFRVFCSPLQRVVLTAKIVCSVTEHDFKKAIMVSGS